MTSPQRFERDLPDLLTDLYVGGMPDYRDDLFRATAASRQRPAWTFLERWIPVDIATRRLPFAPLPWRTIGVLALIIILAAAAVLVAIGSRQHVPPPFGPAANGFILGSSGGDIVVRDTATGETRLLIGGTDADSEPGASPDGSLVAFTRTMGDRRSLAVADIDGSHARVVAGPIVDVWAQWAPDSRHLGVIEEVNGRNEFHLVSTEGKPDVVADLGDLRPFDFQFRPPDGRQIVVRAANGGQVDLYVMNTDGSNVRKLGLHSNGGFGFDMDLTGAGWSPTGEQLGYNAVERDTPTGPDHFRVHVLTLATGKDATFPAPIDPEINQAWPAWSPDGRSIVVQRFTWEKGWLGLLPADGSPAGVREIGPRVGYESDSQMDEGWSPDGSTILLRFNDRHFYSIDVASGKVTTVTWPVDKIPDWRRVAP